MVDGLLAKLFPSPNSAWTVDFVQPNDNSLAGTGLLQRALFCL
jgi:hypothetical protein